MVALNTLLNRKCSCCGSKNVAWHCHEISTSHAVDGRLKLNEISTQFYLGCNECSETIASLSGDEMAGILSNSINQ